MTVNSNVYGPHHNDPYRPDTHGMGREGEQGFHKIHDFRDARNLGNLSYQAAGEPGRVQGFAELGASVAAQETPSTRPDWLDDATPEDDGNESPDVTPASPALPSPDEGPASRHGYDSEGNRSNGVESPSEEAAPSHEDSWRANGHAPRQADAAPSQPSQPSPASPPLQINQLQWFVQEEVEEEVEDSWDQAEAQAVDGPAADGALASTPERAHSAAAEADPAQPTALELSLYADRRYRAALERMQFAQWPETLELLRAVQRDYPHHPTVDALINEAELKAGVVAQWAGKVKGRRLTVRQEMLLRRAAPILLLLLLFVGVAAFYRTFVEPSRQVMAAARANLDMLDEAQQLAFAGRFAEALALYETLLARDPGNPLARQGQRETQGMYALATEYEVAMNVIRAGNLTRAAGMLENLLVKAPGFRDAEAQLTRLETQLTGRELFAAAEADFRLERWLEAVRGYEAILALDNEYQSETVRQRLQESYVQAGQAIVRQWPTDVANATLAQEYFRKAAATRRADAAIQTELNRLDRYFRGEQAQERADLTEAINLWRALYDEEPQYLGGFLAEQLYRSYLSLAHRAVQQGDMLYAVDLYGLAAGLEVRDASEAQRWLDQLRAQAAAPTPTAMPTAEPVAAVAQPPLAAPAQPIASPPTPTPAPTPIPTATPEPDLTGWIAFRTNRGGESIFVMRPDGSEQQPAPESIRSRFQELVEAERRSPDGARVLAVRVLEGRENPSIFVTHVESPDRAPREMQLTDYNRDEYDPVWSPTGDKIAFVSNHPGNDEIFIMNADGTNHRQLTWNEWEWDKHPSFSPDGSQLAFYTNRTGPRQIFVMSADGSNQRNISQSQHDDWDPVWIKG